jgi:hypothetical protein
MSFTFKKPTEIEINETIIKIKTNTWTELYVLSCKHLYKLNKEIMIDLIDNDRINTNRRQYFSKSKRCMYNPKKVATNLYVEANLSANRVMKLLEKLFTIYNIESYQLIYITKGE